MIYSDAFKKMYDMLCDLGYESREVRAWLNILIEEISGIGREQWLMRQDEELPETDEKKLFELFKRLAAGEPVDYIVGCRYFCGLRFEVNENTLIPRQETELLTEEVVKEAAGANKELNILDIGTGSGCIIVSAAHLLKKKLDCESFKRLNFYASDISEEALETARRNAWLHGINASFIKSDMFEELPEISFDIIVSNPPYIPESEASGLDVRVRDHEPNLALFGGKDGLDHYRTIAARAGEHLGEGGLLLLEIGFDQGESVPALLMSAGFSKVRVMKDYAGLDRIVSARYFHNK